MKKILFLFLLCLSISRLHAQLPTTSYEDYMYLTNGVRQALKNGYDIKQGYRLNYITEFSATSGGVLRTCKFYGFCQEGERIPHAYLMVYSRANDNYQDYFCIPANNSEQGIWDMALQKINGYKEPFDYQLFEYCLMRFGTYYPKY